MPRILKASLLLAFSTLVAAGMGGHLRDRPPWGGWDARYFVRALDTGFRHADGSATFHPLFVWLARPVYLVTGERLWSLILVAWLAGLLVAHVFERLARLDLPSEEAHKATILFLFFPASYVLWAPYTESTFILFAALTLLCARQKKWLLAGLCAALATLTRQQGLFLALPLAWEAWEGRRLTPRTFLALALAPASYVLWVAYRMSTSGEPSLDLTTPQDVVYGLLIAPAAKNVVFDQAFLIPPYGLYVAAVKLSQGVTFQQCVDLTMGALFIAATCLAWKGMRPSYRLYTLTIVLLSLACVTGPSNLGTYFGLPRHLLLAFPVFIVLAPRLSRPVYERTVRFGFFGALLLAFVHGLMVWVP